MICVPSDHLRSGIRDFGFRLKSLELVHLVDPSQGPRE
jgi:hypothetical protein